MGWLLANRALDSKIYAISLLSPSLFICSNFAVTLMFYATLHLEAIRGPVIGQFVASMWLLIITLSGLVVSFLSRTNKP